MTLVKSVENRQVKIYWITAQKNVNKDKNMQKINGLFPFSYEKMPYDFKTNCFIYLSARVHPSETASSYFLYSYLQEAISDYKKK